MRYLSLLLLLPVIIQPMDNPKLPIIQQKIIDQQQLFRHRDIDFEYVYSYPMERIIKQFARVYDINLEEVCKIEMDLKTFLLNSALSDKAQRMYFRQTADLWHFFILHTKEYHMFCFRCFGKFIHHHPTQHDSFNMKDSCRLSLLHILNEHEY